MSNQIDTVIQITDRQPIGNFDVDTNWTALNDDANLITISNQHVLGLKSIGFDKANGTANTTKAIIESTIEGIDIRRFSQEARVVSSIRIPSITNVVNMFIRLGTDNANYSQWTFPVAGLTGGDIWELLSKKLHEVDWTAIGNGMNSASITYIAIGVTFNLETDILDGIGWDNVVITA